MYKNDYENSVGPGWKPLVQPLIDYCKENDIYIVQIKEKFGGLRFYADGCDEGMYAFIHAVEQQASQTCEVCGEPGEVSGGTRGWLKCLCPKHHKVREEGGNIWEGIYE